MTYTIDSISEEEERQRTLNRLQRQINDQQIVLQVLPDHYKQYMLKNIHSNYEVLARKSYGCNRRLFNHAYAELRRLSPNGRYLPSSPRHLTITSRWLGYPRAEHVSSIYRRLVPRTWRKKFYKS